MENISIFQLGDQAATAMLSNTIDEKNHQRLMAMKRWIDDHAFAGLLDSILSYGSLTLLYDVYSLKRSIGTTEAFQFVHQMLHQAYAHTVNTGDPATSSVVRIPVCYEAPFCPDLDFVCSHQGLDRQTVIDLHTGKTHRVYMVGFLPGFPYMATVDSRIAVPRKATPRTRVEAGSVGIAGVQTGIYPVDSPGGWQIIGRTPWRLFGKDDDPPVTLEAGNDVQFYPISRKVFDQYPAR